MTNEDTQPRPEEVEPVPRRFWWLKRIAVGVAILVVALAGLRWWWGCRASALLHAEIERCRAAGQPIFPSDFDPTPVDNKDNAALVLEQAAQAVKAVTLQLDLVGEPEAIRQRRDEVRKMVESGAKGMALVRKARSMPDADWGIRLRSPVFPFLLPALSDQRKLAKLLAVSATYAHLNGDDAAAIESLRDILGLARHVDRQPFLMSHLVAIASNGVVARCVEGLAPDLRVSEGPVAADVSTKPATPAQVEALIGELLDEQGTRRGMVQGLYAERMALVDSAQLIWEARLSPASLMMGATAPPGPWGRAAVFPFKPLFQLDAVRIIRCMDAWAEAVQAPTWPACQARWTEPPATDSGLERVSWPLSILTPSFERAVILHFRSLVSRRMAAVALAIRMYELDHGRRPARLDALVPEYLAAVPEDPFAADGHKLDYNRTAERPVLYSVNLNGVDENGAFATRPTGGIDWEAKDLPFFLNGDRPSRAPTTSPSAPTSSKTDEDQPDVGHHEGNAQEGQDREHEPYDR